MDVYRSLLRPFESNKNFVEHFLASVFDQEHAKRNLRFRANRWTSL